MPRREISTLSPCLLNSDDCYALVDFAALGRGYRPVFDDSDSDQQTDFSDTDERTDSDASESSDSETDDLEAPDSDLDDILARIRSYCISHRTCKSPTNNTQTRVDDLKLDLDSLPPLPTITSKSGRNSVDNTNRSTQPVLQRQTNGRSHHDQHQKVKQKRSLLQGYYSRNGHWVEFRDWVPKYLQPGTRNLLQTMMKQDPTTDEPGYSYAFEILLKDNHHETHVKVGREKTFGERTKYWARHYGPGNTRLIFSGGDVREAYPKTRRGGPRVVPYYKRLERLVLIELQDLVQHRAYRHPDFPNAEEPPAYRGKEPTKPCLRANCNVRHVEVFPFVHPARNSVLNVEEIVINTIERWSDFCRICY